MQKWWDQGYRTCTYKAHFYKNNPKPSCGFGLFYKKRSFSELWVVITNQTKWKKKKNDLSSILSFGSEQSEFLFFLPVNHIILHLDIFYFDLSLKKLIVKFDDVENEPLEIIIIVFDIGSKYQNQFRNNDFRRVRSDHPTLKSHQIWI